MVPSSLEVLFDKAVKLFSLKVLEFCYLFFSCCQSISLIHFKSSWWLSIWCFLFEGVFHNHMSHKVVGAVFIELWWKFSHVLLAIWGHTIFCSSEKFHWMISICIITKLNEISLTFTIGWAFAIWLRNDASMVISVIRVNF